MPADWVPDTVMDYPDRIQIMRHVYTEGLDRLGVPGIMDALRGMCLAAVEPQEDAGSETVTNPPGEVSDHDGMAV
jgi:hypothetical protein